MVQVRPLVDGDRSWLRELVAREWGLPVVSVSGIYDPGELDGYVAIEEGSPVGAVTYRVSEGAFEVVTLNALQIGRGIGKALLAAAKQAADDRNTRLWLITTETNTHAIEFYQRQGMRRVAIHPDFIDTVLRHKPHLADDATGARLFTNALEFSY